jgi:hypothetical protein
MRFEYRPLGSLVIDFRKLPTDDVGELSVYAPDLNTKIGLQNCQLTCITPDIGSNSIRSFTQRASPSRRAFALDKLQLPRYFISKF